MLSACLIVRPQDPHLIKDHVQNNCFFPSSICECMVFYWRGFGWLDSSSADTVLAASQCAGHHGGIAWPGQFGSFNRRNWCRALSNQPLPDGFNSSASYAGNTRSRGCRCKRKSTDATAPTQGPATQPIPAFCARKYGQNASAFWV